MKLPVIILPVSHPLNFQSEIFSDREDGELKGFLTRLYGDDFNLDYISYYHNEEGELVINFQ